MGLSETTREYYIAPYSNRGDRVDILAPGEAFTTTIQGQSELLSTYKSMQGEMDPNLFSYYINKIEGNPDFNDYDFATGTSIAAPYVTGAIGLAYSVNPNISASDMKRALINSARDENLGTNVLDVAALIRTVRTYDLDYGMLSGKITCDDTGVAPANVHICIFDVSNQMLLKEFSVETGFYELSLNAGVYKISFAADGYKAYSSAEINIGDRFKNIHDVILNIQTASTETSSISNPAETEKYPKVVVAFMDENGDPYSNVRATFQIAGGGFSKYMVGETDESGNLAIYYDFEERGYPIFITDPETKKTWYTTMTWNKESAETRRDSSGKYEYYYIPIQIERGSWRL